MPYPVREITFNPRDWATHQSLQRVAAYGKSADATSRQVAIDYVVTAHAFDKAHTKSLLYDPQLDLPGRNIHGEIRIGPKAFTQDQAWLAGIVFHELVHSPQAAYYASKGVTQINPTLSEIERRMLALDEFEAYWWQLKRGGALGFSEAQYADVRRRAQFALIDVDDEKVAELAKKQQFNAGRDELIRQYSARPAGSQAVKLRRSHASCCA